MKKLKRILFPIITAFFFSASVYANGIEFKITVSGKLLLGIAYRHQLDSNTAIRIGSFMGIAGAPVGMQLGILQDFEPSKKWSPTFGVGIDAIIFKKGDEFARRVYPSALCGIALTPQKNEKHSAELWLGRPSHKILPMGMSYSYLTKIF